MTTGEQIAALRRKAGLSQEALADKLGLSRQAVSKWEADLSVPGMDNLVELATLFGVPTDALLRPNEPTRQAPEEQRATEQTATAGSVADKPPLARGVKWSMVALAVLLCVSVLCNGLSLLWLARLQEQVNGIPLGGGTVYMPAAPQAESELADYAVDYTYDSPTDTLRFTMRAVPREVEIGATAQFTIQNGAQTYTADAESDGTGYRATMETVAASGDYAVFLLLSEAGRQRSMAVDTVYNPTARYRLSIERVEQKADTVEVRVTVSSSEVWPVSGTVTVRAADGTQTHYPLDNMGNPHEEHDAASATEQAAEAAGDVTLYCRAYQVKNAQGAELEVTITDNFGRVTTYPSKP